MSAPPSGGGGPPPEGGRPSSDLSPTRTHLDPLAGLAPGRVLAGRYRIEGLLGAGGMGVVYRARDLELDIDVAVKLLRPEHAARQQTRDRFRSELILARQVSHRNVVRIHDIDRDGELEFLTMDLVEGRSLRELIADGPLATDRAMAIARQLAEALAAAHDEGVVHRDLKPANVVVDRDDRAWITDFGVARSIGAGAGVTRPGALVGTVDYLSPEQARGEQVDGRSDLYGLGLLLFEMLSGRLPFGAGSTAELVAERIAGHPRSLAEVGTAAPPELEAVIRRCLEREPARRYPDARALIADLDRAAAGETTAATRRRRWRWALAAALAAAVLVVGGAAAVRLGRPAADGPAAAGAPRHVVAVLPFADQTGRAELAWTSRGLAESLASALAESPALRVVDSLRLFQMTEDLDVAPGPLSDRELRRVAELVEADRVVTGQVRTAGSEVRLDLVLAAVGPGRVGTTPLAESGPPERLFDLVGRLGSELRGRLEVPPAGRPARRLSTVPAALASYSKGVEGLVAGDALGAAPALERAVEADPEFTAAWVRLADAYQELGYGDKARDAARRAVATLDEGTGSRLAFEARAREAALGGEPERAVEILQQLVERYPNDVEARMALARALGQTGDLGAAETALGKVVELDPNHPRAWFDLARYAIRRGDSRRAIDDYLVRARVIQNRLGSRQGQADVINGLGVAYHQLGDLDRAAENFAEAAELRRQIGDDRGYAGTLHNLALIEMARGRYDEAERHVVTALGLLETIGNRDGVADLENFYGTLEEEQGHYHEALEHYRRGLAVRRDLGEPLALAESLTNVGYAYFLLGEYDNALVYQRQALELYRDKDDPDGVVASSQSIGYLELAQGRWDRATRTFLTALESSRELDMPAATAASLANLGRLAQYQGRYAAALDSYHDAQRVVADLGDGRGEVEFGLFEVETLLELGRLDDAAARLGAVGQRLEANPNREQRAELLRLGGRLALARGELAAAARDLAAARREAEASHALVAELAARLGEAEVTLGRGDAAGARRALGPLAERVERLGHAPLRLAVADAEARAALAAGDAAAAETAARRGLRLVGDVGSWAGAHRLHATLAEALERRGERAAAEAQLEQARAELERLREGAPEEVSELARRSS